ncbi:MAG: M23 family metallopeptidase [Verrucomicrobia bacterium]|nr:M23 family metallopeptidase [Verrucomicrobiota bacterium]
MRRMGWGWIGALALAAGAVGEGLGETFVLPTANRALYEPGQEDRYYVGTVGQPWVTGTFGCVRTRGQQFHEGLDIRCLERDAAGEPVDAVRATADGEVMYANRRASLSNYGCYVVVRHRIEGLEVYSLYAHLQDVRDGLAAGWTVRAGEALGRLGRTTNTREPISKARAHLHFELGLRASDRYAQWHQRNRPDTRNDHGEWHGHNLLGMDPAWILLEQARRGSHFSLLEFLRRQPELCRVLVRGGTFGWAQRHAALVLPNARAAREGTAGYEVALAFNGLPVRVTPRAASEADLSRRFQLLEVNEGEAQTRRCQSLVVRRDGHWSLSGAGERLLDLLAF